MMELLLDYMLGLTVPEVYSAFAQRSNPGQTLSAKMDRQERLFRMLSFGANRKRKMQTGECATEPNTSLHCEKPVVHPGEASNIGGKLKDDFHLLTEQGLKLFEGSAGVLVEEEGKRPSKKFAEKSTLGSLEKRTNSRNARVSGNQDGGNPLERDRLFYVEELRRKHSIFVYGEDIPSPCCTFDEIYKHLPAELATNIRELGFRVPTKIQMQAIPTMLEDREIMANAPTGSGKTLSFVIPALNEILKNKNPEDHMCQVLVVEPTLELARQVYFDFLRVIGNLPITVCLSSKHVNNPLGSRYDVIVSTPNRLIYSMEAEPSLYDLSKVKWLIIDECDRLFEAGERGFREQLSRIYQACNNVQTRRALFSATFSYHLEQWCKVNLNSLVFICVGARNSAVSSVVQKLVFVGSEHGKLVALERMFAEGLQPPLLIFVQSKERTEQLHSELLCMNLSAELIHANRTAEQREASMKRFRTGEVPIMVCSELVGRGIDFKAVNTVVNYDFPISSVSYIHCIGRTGRAGRSGTAITFFTESDTPLLRNIGNIIKAAGCPVPDYILKLPKASRNAKRWLASHAPKREPICNLPDRKPGKRRKTYRNPRTKHADASAVGDSSERARKDVAVKARKGVNPSEKVLPKSKRKKEPIGGGDFARSAIRAHTKKRGKNALNRDNRGQKVRRKE